MPSPLRIPWIHEGWTPAEIELACREIFEDKDVIRYWYEAFDQVFSKEITSAWDYQYLYNSFLYRHNLKREEILSYIFQMKKVKLREVN